MGSQKLTMASFECDKYASLNDRVQGHFGEVILKRSECVIELTMLWQHAVEDTTS